MFEAIDRFLMPFAAVTTHMSGSKYPTLAAVIPFYNRLCDHLDDTIDDYEHSEDEKVFILI